MNYIFQRRSGCHITTQGKRVIWLREVEKMYWVGLVAKAQLHGGEVVTLGEYESADEQEDVTKTCCFLMNFICRYRFPEYGYYKKYYAEEDNEQDD